MSNKNRVYVQYKPEHYIGDIAITVHCKESEYTGDYFPWFKSFIKQRELDLEVINNLIKTEKYNNRMHWTGNSTGQ